MSVAVLRLPLPARRTFSVTASPAGMLLRSTLVGDAELPDGALEVGASRNREDLQG